MQSQKNGGFPLTLSSLDRRHLYDFSGQPSQKPFLCLTLWCMADRTPLFSELGHVQCPTFVAESRAVHFVLTVTTYCATARTSHYHQLMHYDSTFEALPHTAHPLSQFLPSLPPTTPCWTTPLLLFHLPISTIHNSFLPFAVLLWDWDYVSQPVLHH